ncbi:hypothetical protein D3C79_791940 [compost metagenome]
MAWEALVQHVLAGKLHKGFERIVERATTVAPLVDLMGCLFPRRELDRESALVTQGAHVQPLARLEAHDGQEVCREADFAPFPDTVERELLGDQVRLGEMRCHDGPCH